MFCSFGILFEKHCEEGDARLGTQQRLQAMSDTVQAAVIDWLAQHPGATAEERIRLDLGNITYTVLLRALCCDLE